MNIFPSGNANAIIHFKVMSTTVPNEKSIHKILNFNKLRFEVFKKYTG